MIVLVLACAPAPQADTAAPPGPADVDYDWAAPAVTATYTADEVDDAVMRTIVEESIHPLSLGAWFVGIADDVTQAAVGCPPDLQPSETRPDSETQDWSGDCVGPEYTVHGGWMSMYTHRVDGGGTTDSLDMLFSFTGAHTVTGDSLAAGGKLTTTVTTRGDTVEFALLSQGTFVDVGEAGPLQAGVSMAVDWVGQYQRGRGVTGTFDGAIGGAETSLVLDALTLADEPGATPTGRVLLRDPSSGWWSVELSGDDGCGPLSWGGAVVGESCAGRTAIDTLNSLFDVALEGA